MTLHKGPTVRARRVRRALVGMAVCGGCAAVVALAGPAASAHTAPPASTPEPVAAPDPGGPDAARPSPQPTAPGGASSPGPPRDQSGPRSPGPETTPGPAPSDAPSPTPAPTPAPSPAPPDGGEQADGGQDPAWWDIGGRIRQAINDWFRGLVTSAINPVFGLIGRTLLATPDVEALDRVHQLWADNLVLANTVFVLFIVAGGLVVMSHETLQTRYTLKEIAPRVVVGFAAANASLTICERAIRVANALSAGLMGRGVDPDQAATTLTNLVISTVTGEGAFFLVLIALVAAVMGLVVLVTYVVRVALVILLTAAGPLALACHALPQTEGVAKLWWRAFAGCLAVQVGQSLTLITALRVFFTPGGANRGVFELPTTGGLVELLIVVCLLYILIRIPFWAGRVIFRGGQPPGATVTRLVKYRVLPKALKAATTKA